MQIQRLLNEQRTLTRAPSDELRALAPRVRSVVSRLRHELARAKQRTQIFVGGSFAKGTLVKKSSYDIDIFVRFATMSDDAVAILERCVTHVAAHEGLTKRRIHGSRDYFQLQPTSGEVIFEIIPVRLVRKPSQAENVTDLSYFHVAYVKKHLTKAMADDVRLAKQFCQAQGMYGAESYIRGFSGYGLECLIIHYKTFMAMVRALARAETPIVLDPSRQYKNAFEARLSLNESKTQNPIVLVDPTHKERNVLAALSDEQFARFQTVARQFLARPSERFFTEQPFEPEQFTKLAARAKAQAVVITLTTDRQAGDIAGTKLKKSGSYLMDQLAREFVVKKHQFIYEGAQSARLYLILKSRGIIERRGPFLTMKAACAAFKRAHRQTIVRGKRLWARVPLTNSVREAFDVIMHAREQLYQMGLVDAVIQDL